MTKPCSGCERELPIERFHRKLNGHASRCRECVSAQQRAYRAANHAHVRTLEGARVERSRDTRRAGDRAYHARNRERRNADSKAWAEGNADWIREYQRAYYRKHRERKRVDVEAWRQANPALSREYRRLAASRRRARLAGLPAERFTVQDVWDRDAVDSIAECYLCAAPVELASAHIEHLIPIAARADDLERHNLANPGSVLVNVALAHGPCNKSKGRKLDPRAVQRYRQNVERDAAAVSSV